MRLLVTDLDNTAWDWVEAWYHPFVAMMGRVAAITGVPHTELYRSAQIVFRRHGTSEYAFVLEEMPCLLEHYGGVVHLDELRPAIEAYRETRERVLVLYPGVVETLATLREAGCQIVAYTESLSYYARTRVFRTGLAPLLDRLYSPPDHDLPDHRERYDSAYDDRAAASLDRRETPEGQLKPSTKILQGILDDFGVSPQETVYVGDSLMKDIHMAQSVGVHDVHASYGCRHDDDAYELLRRVTHWTDEDMERQQRIRSMGAVRPTYVAAGGFSDVLDVIEEVSGQGARAPGW